MFRNGLNPRIGIGMHGGALRHALRRVADPNLVGAGMLLEARGNVYGDVSTVPAATVAKRRARNKAARAARRKGRR